VFVLGLDFLKGKNSCPVLPSLPEKEYKLTGNADNLH
jgi:hypothetical protein